MGKATKVVQDLPDDVWEQKKKEIHAFKNCSVCDERLVLNLCHYREEKYYCVEHCLGHKWQSHYDWQTECAKCGLSYIDYLKSLLEQHKIPFSKP